MGGITYVVEKILNNLDGLEDVFLCMEAIYKGDFVAEKCFRDVLKVHPPFLVVVFKDSRLSFPVVGIAFAGGDVGNIVDSSLHCNISGVGILTVLTPTLCYEAPTK